MAGQRPYGLLSAGAIAIFLGVIFYLSINEVISLIEVPALTLLFSGIWVLFIALLKSVNPTPYEMGAFSTASWGILFSSIGALWFLTFRGFSVNIVVVTFFIIIGILLIVVALREWLTQGKKQKIDKELSYAKQ